MVVLSTNERKSKFKRGTLLCTFYGWNPLIFLVNISILDVEQVSKYASAYPYI